MQYFGDKQLDNSVSTKFRYTNMPTATVSNLGKILQYVGTTTADYVNGYFYKCVEDATTSPSTYKWNNIGTNILLEPVDLEYWNDLKLEEGNPQKIFYKKREPFLIDRYRLNDTLTARGFTLDNRGVVANDGSLQESWDYINENWSSVETSQFVVDSNGLLYRYDDGEGNERSAFNGMPPTKFDARVAIDYKLFELGGDVLVDDYTIGKDSDNQLYLKAGCITLIRFNQTVLNKKSATLSDDDSHLATSGLIKKELAKKLPAYSIMPSATSSNVNETCQFIGTTTAEYTDGYFYKCVSDGASTPTYSWKNIKVQDSVMEVLAVAIAPEYSASSIYAVGDVVMHDGNRYFCNTAITVAEAWTPAHWTQQSVENGKLSLTGGTMTGAITSNSNSALDLNTGENGAAVKLYGVDSSRVGDFEIVAGGNFDTVSLVGHNERDACYLTWNGANILTVNNIIDNLTSTSKVDALSANQGKTLNAKFGSYLPLSGGTMTGALTFNNGKKINDYLPLDGGTLTGNLMISKSAALFILQATANNSAIQFWDLSNGVIGSLLCGTSGAILLGRKPTNNNNWNNGALLTLNVDGSAVLRGTDDTGATAKTLTVNSSGITVDGTMFVKAGSDAILTTMDNSAVLFGGGTSKTNGSYIQMFGKSHASKAGWIVYSTRKSDGTELQMITKPDGTFTWNGNNVCIDTAPTWSNLDTDGKVKYTKKNGVVYLTCNAYYPATTGTVTVGTLPTGYRPSIQVSIGLCDTNGAGVRMLINSTGVVIISAKTASIAHYGSGSFPV